MEIILIRTLFEYWNNIGKENKKIVFLCVAIALVVAAIIAIFITIIVLRNIEVLAE
jgi:hypothetical protein